MPRTCPRVSPGRVSPTRSGACRCFASSDSVSCRRPPARRSAAAPTPSAAASGRCPYTSSDAASRSTAALLASTARRRGTRMGSCRTCSIATRRACGPSSRTACACASCGTTRRCPGSPGSSSISKRCSRARSTPTLCSCGSWLTQRASHRGRMNGPRHAGWSSGPARRNGRARGRWGNCAAASNASCKSWVRVSPLTRRMPGCEKRSAAGRWSWMTSTANSCVSCTG